MARILIVEDDGDLQQMLSIALNQEGYEVHYAFNGKEGYEKILGVQPDVILLDLMMPVLNGVEVIKLVTTNTLVRDIPIIVMTAHGDKADMLEHSIKAQGVRAYIRKPFELQDMRATVRRLLAQYPRKPVASAQIAKGQLRLDTKTRTVWSSDKLVATLAPTRAELLRVLLQAAGPVTREKLLKEVWGAEGSVSALEKTVQRLRQDLGEDAPKLLTTPDGYELVG